MTPTTITHTQVHLEVRDNCAWILLDGPATRNALDGRSASAIVAACEKIDDDSSIGAAVITGVDGSFCSGAVQGVLANLEGAAAHTVYEALDSLYAAFARVGKLRVPTIARLDGPAVGAGVNLALACDLRIASPRARFISGFAAMGIHPGGGHFHLLDRLVGRQTAAAMGLFADSVSAVHAERIGLTWATVDNTDLDKTIGRLVVPLCADPLLARHAKSSFALTTTPTEAWTAATEVERSRQMWSLTRDRASTP